MKQQLTHKIRLDPNNAQAVYFARACGTARFAYNWALAEWNRQYAACRQDDTLPRPSQFTLRKQLNSIKRTEFPWMLEVTKCAPQAAIINLGQAFDNYFKSLNGSRKGKKLARPKFKKKGVRDSFKISNDQLDVKGSSIRIPNLGWVRMRESLRFMGKLISATVSRTADHWFVAITVETEDLPSACESQASVGVDLGVKTFAVLSDGTEFIGPKALNRLLSGLRRLNKSLHRKVKGSQNRKKAAMKVARLHYRIACVRNDATHKLTHYLATNYGAVAIEDLNVAGMVRNRHLSRHIADASFGEFRRQLEYKAAMRGVQVLVAPRFFGSSKTCSCCGAINEALRLSDRHWACTACGETHDRDHNAAKNILMAASCAVTASGVASSGGDRKMSVKLATMKQESKTVAQMTTV